MKLKSVLSAVVAVGAMALMAVGVQAATYSAGAVSPKAGVAEVPVLVSPDAGEAGVQVNGYVMKFTYDKTKVTPKLAANKDAAGGDCYAVAGTGFDGADSVLVCDIVKEEGNNQTLAVAWASAKPVAVNAANTAMASVDFDVASTAKGEVPIAVELVALTNNGTADTATSATVANGKVTINAEKFLRGDANGDNVVDISDASLISKSLVGLATIEEKNGLKADANADGTVDISDASLISKSLVGLGIIPE